MSGDQLNQADPLDLDAILERAELATSGPWVSGEPRSEHPRYGVTSEAIDLEDQDNTIAAHVLDYTDAAFIAHAREDVPALVAEVRRLREDLSKAHFVMGTHAMRAIGVEPPE